MYICLYADCVVLLHRQQNVQADNVYLTHTTNAHKFAGYIIVFLHR